MGSIRQKYDTGKTVYAKFWADGGTIWHTVSGAYESYLTANYANYLVAATELGTASGMYQVTVPAGVALNNYTAEWCVVPDGGAIGAAAETDPAIASQRYLSLSDVVDEIYDEPLAGHVTAGSGGKALSDAAAGAGVSSPVHITTKQTNIVSE